MSQQRIRNIDFLSTATIPAINGAIYSGYGTPNGIITSPNSGALYTDLLGSQVWVCSIPNSTSAYAWIPLGSIVISNQRIDTNVQEGDLVGIFGAGTWTTSGNLNTSRIYPALFGSQVAAIIAGGANTAGTGLITSESFNGSIWSTAPGNLTLSRAQAGAAGSYNAGIVTTGAHSGSVITSTELFNGSTWTAGSNVNTARELAPAIGSQNTTLVINGTTVPASLSSTELYNGSAWSLSQNTNFSRVEMFAVGTPNAVLAGGGRFLVTSAITQTITETFNGSAWSYNAYTNSKNNKTGAGTPNSAIVMGQTTSEIFNGSVWSYSGVPSVSVSSNGMCGSQGATIVAGGAVATVSQNTTQFHSQSIYRKLTYPDYASASNVGMAYNTNNTSLTASVIMSVMPSNFVPPYFKQDAVATSMIYNNQFFGITKFGNDQGIPYLDTTATSTSLTVSSPGNAQLNLSTSLNWFYIGMLLSVTNTGSQIPTGVYPVVGGTSGAPIVRWEGATNGSITATVAPVISGHIQGCTATNITTTTLNGSLAMNITLTNSGLTSNQMNRLIKINDLISIPYAATAGANGSYYNYGTYQIQLISGTTYTVYQLNPLQVNETNIGTISVLGGIVTNPICLDDDSILLGLNSRIGLTGNPSWSDSANGPV